MGFPTAVRVVVVKNGKETELSPKTVVWGHNAKRHPRMEIVLDADAVLALLVEAHGTVDMTNPPPITISATWKDKPTGENTLKVVAPRKTRKPKKADGGKQV